MKLYKVGTVVWYEGGLYRVMTVPQNDTGQYYLGNAEYARHSELRRASRSSIDSRINELTQQLKRLQELKAEL